MRSRFRPIRISCLALAASLALAAAPARAQKIEGPPPSKAPAKAPPESPRVVEGIASLKVPASGSWTSSGVAVRRGDRVRVRAWGRVRIGGPRGTLTDPAGLEGGGADTLLDTAPACSLVAAVGDESLKYVAVGREAEFAAPADGLLFFSLNQTDPARNVGSFDVRVTVGEAYGLSTGAGSPFARAPLGPPPPTAPSSSPDERVVEVSAQLDWTNTYLTVRPGDRVVVEATGSVVLDLAGKSTGPDGVAVRDPNRLLPDKPTGALIAVVGVDNNDFMFVGSKAELVAARAGLLFLGVNEEDLTNNAGGFRARVRVVRAAK